MKIKLLLAASLLAGFAAAQSPLNTFPINGGTLTQANTNNGLPADDGMYFDLVANTDLIIQRIDINTDDVATGILLDVWTCPGGYSGNENSPAAWTLVSSGTTGNTPGAGTDLATVVDIPDFILSTGTTGIFLGYPNASQNYITGGGSLPTQQSTNELTMIFGGSQNTQSTPGGGIQNTPRIFSGAVHYVPAAGLYPSFTADVTSGLSPLTVTFTDTTYTSDPAGVLLVEFDFENDGAFDVNTIGGGVVTHTYPCGLFSVGIRALDAVHGLVTDSVTDLISVDEFQASFTQSGSFGSAGDTIQYTYTGDPGATLLWDLDGDGNVDAVGANVSWVYGSPGDYTVTLDAQLNCRTQTVTSSVSIVDQFLEAPAGSGFTSFSSPPDVAYFDLSVATPLGIQVTAMGARSPVVGSPHTYEVWGILGSSVSNNFARSNFTLLSSGTWTPSAADALEVVDVTDFNLPQGTHGIAVVHRAAGGSAGHTWYTSNSGLVASNGDITIIPRGSDSDFDSQTSNTAISSTSNSFAGTVFYSLGGSLPQPGSVVKFGDGCPGALGVPRIAPGLTLPAQGTTYSLRVRDVTRAVILHGGASASFNATFGVPLPFKLGPVLGMQSSCFFRVSSEVIFPPVQPNAANEATISFPIPTNPQFTGLGVFFQALVFDGTVPGNLVVSDAWLAVVL